MADNKRKYSLTHCLQLQALIDNGKDEAKVSIEFILFQKFREYVPTIIPPLHKSILNA